MPNIVPNKESVYAALRHTELPAILSALAVPAVKKQFVELATAGDADLLALLDLQIDLGQAQWICEIMAKMGVSFIPKIAPEAILSRAVAEVVNVERKLMLFHFTDIAQKLGISNRETKRPGICWDMVKKIYEYALDDSTPITEEDMMLAATTKEQPRKLAFGWNV